VVPVFSTPTTRPTSLRPGAATSSARRFATRSRAYPENLRVGVVASGGLSHFTVDETLDGNVIRALREKDANALQSLPREQLNSGSSEIRNWICAAGALEHLELQWVQYTPGYRTPAGTGTGLCFCYWH
jgi:3-O-methylgallate 3,4-dioxygenase